MNERYENIKIKLMMFVLVELVVLIFFNLFIDDYLAFLQYVFILVNLGLVFYMFYSMRESRKERIMSVTQILGSRAKDVFDYGQVGVLTFNQQKEITWVSEIFDDYERDFVGEYLHDAFPKIETLLSSKEEILRITIDSDIYEVSSMAQDGILYFRDVTKIDVLEESNKNNQVVLGIAHLDNYEETTQYEEEQTIAFIDANIRQAVVRWADQHSMFVRRIRQDRYLLVLNEKVFRDITQERFTILNEIRKEATKIDASITLSLAFARQSDSFKELEDMSNRALELAQSRGGDQVAINTKNQSMRYFGGSTESIEKRSKVRVRVMAQSLADLMQSCKDIVIIGHKMTDFDCFGSALGVSSIAAVYQKNVSIVLDLDDTESNLKKAIEQNIEEIEKDHQFISISQAKDIINKDTLVIMVDHHSLDQTQFPELIEQAAQIAVIDHHRRLGDFNFKPKLTYIESSASSASELVIELFPYHRRNVVISKIQATFMYTGMIIDTNRFRNRSGSRTFEAAAELRKFGADLELSDEMLRDEYQDFELKNRILARAQLFEEHYIIATYKDSEVPRAIMSQVADEILSVRNVEASFVIASVSDDLVAISARSNGELNVQLVMEKMGGGGHFTGAATQIRGISINDVNEQLKEAIQTVKEESL